MTNVCYTADLHFGHRNIIRYCERLWRTPEEMDARMVERLLDDYPAC